MFAESPVGVLVHWNASKTPIVRPARVDTSLLWLFVYFALEIFTLHVLQGPQVKVALSLILEHLAVTIFRHHFFVFNAKAAKLCKEQQISFGNSTKYSDFIDSKYFLKN